MTGGRGDAAATRRAILAAARELFAARGVTGVSVRDIAARAGVNHALVHRYFGAKDDMVAAILRAEAETMSSGLGRDAEAPESLETLRSILDYALTDGRTSLLLMLRAELDGLSPERLRDDAVLRPIAALSGWLEAHHSGSPGLEPRALAMLLVAAVLGFAGAQPLLSAGAGYRDEDPDEVRRLVVDALVGVVAVAAGREPPPRPPEIDRPHETEENHP